MIATICHAVSEDNKVQCSLDKHVWHVGKHLVTGCSEWNTTPYRSIPQINVVEVHTQFATSDEMNPEESDIPGVGIRASLALTNAFRQHNREYARLLHAMVIAQDTVKSYRHMVEHGDFPFMLHNWHNLVEGFVYENDNVLSWGFGFLKQSYVYDMHSKRWEDTPYFDDLLILALIQNPPVSTVIRSALEISNRAIPFFEAPM